MQDGGYALRYDDFNIWDLKYIERDSPMLFGPLVFVCE